MRALGLIMLVAALATPPAPGATDEGELLATVKAFYRWALVHSGEVRALEPKILADRKGKGFHLDRGQLDTFVGKFMSSGLFAPEFAAAVKRYYARYDARIRAMDEADFDRVARDGRGPIMEAEDMDIFFCAQEYEYEPAYVDAFELTSAKLAGGRAQVEVRSPREWPVRFSMVREGGRWLIAGYCVFQ